MRFKTTLIGFTLVSSLALQGCYTQLAMFYPDPEEELETYSRAGARPSVDMYAQDSGSGSPLAYSTMQNRFSPFYGYNNYYNNPYRFYNDPYSGYGGYGGYGFGYNNYGYSYNLGGYDMFVPFIPVAGEKDIRQFTKDRNRTTTTNLQVNRTSNTNENSRSSSSRNSGSSGSYSSGNNSSSSSSSSSSGSSSGGRRATRRN